MTRNADSRSHLVQNRARALRERADRQRRAVPSGTDRGTDHAEQPGMGLHENANQSATLGGRLAEYVKQVAAAIEVPVEATGYEVSDTATAYLGLDQRWATHPDHDLMLVWDERLGWYIGVETTPAEAPEVLAYLDGDTVPTPAAVARFVGEMTDGRPVSRVRPVLAAVERAELAAKLAAVLA